MKHSRPTDDATFRRMPNLDALVELPTFSKLTQLEERLHQQYTVHLALLYPLPPALSQPAESTSSPSLPIPTKLIKKILNLELVEMSKFAPESWEWESNMASQC